MARYVTLGKKANFFRDSHFDISIAKGEVVELNAMQLNSPAIRKALQGGHLIFTEKPSAETKAAPVQEEKKELTPEELAEAFMGFVGKKDPQKKIKKNFNLDQLKAIAPLFDVEVEEDDTVDTLIETILEAANTKED